LYNESEEFTGLGFFQAKDCQAEMYPILQDVVYGVESLEFFLFFTWDL